jgi:hypothetical protein
MPSLQEIQEQVKSLPIKDTFGTKKEIKELPKILKEDERVLALTSGLMDNNTWLIVLTHRRVIFLDKGMIYGLKQVETPLEKINSIEHKIGMIMGEIHIWDGSSKMSIRNCIKNTVQPFVNALNDALEVSKKGGHAPSSNSVADELQKLASLKEQGILSEEEFAAEKGKLLAS